MESSRLGAEKSEASMELELEAARRVLVNCTPDSSACQDDDIMVAGAMVCPDSQEVRNDFYVDESSDSIGSENVSQMLKKATMASLADRMVVPESQPADASSDHDSFGLPVERSDESTFDQQFHIDLSNRLDQVYSNRKTKKSKEALSSKSSKHEKKGRKGTKKNLMTSVVFSSEEESEELNPGLLVVTSQKPSPHPVKASPKPKEKSNVPKRSPKPSVKSKNKKPLIPIVEFTSEEDEGPSADISEMSSVFSLAGTIGNNNQNNRVLLSSTRISEIDQSVMLMSNQLDRMLDGKGKDRSLKNISKISSEESLSERRFKKKKPAKSKRPNLLTNLAFSSEEENETMEKKKLTPAAEPVPKKKVKPKTKTPRARATPSKKRFAEAVAFSSPEDDFSEAGSTHISSESFTPRSSVSSNHTEDDISLLSQKFDSILIGKSLKKKKPAIPKTKMIPELSSSSEDEQQENIPVHEESSAEPQMQNFSLQCSLMSAPPALGSSASEANSDGEKDSSREDMPPTPEMADCSLQVSMTSTKSSSADFQSQSFIEKLQKTRNMMCDWSETSTPPEDLCDTSNKGLQVSMMSGPDSSPELGMSKSLQVSMAPQSDEEFEDENDVSCQSSQPDNNALYQTAFMDDAELSDENNLYKTVMEYQDDGVTDRGARRKSRTVLGSLGLPRNIHSNTPRRSVVVSDDDELSDKENHIPPCLSSSSEGSCAGNSCKKKSGAVSRFTEDDDSFLVSEEDSPVVSLQNRLVGKPKVKVGSTSRAINRITFSSDDESENRNRAASPASRKAETTVNRRSFTSKAPKLLNIKHKAQSPLLVALSDKKDEELPDLPRNTPRKPAKVLSDSSDDDLESFFDKVRRSEKKTRPLPRMDDFIVSDDDVTSDDSAEDDDNSVFYIRTNRDLDRRKPEMVEISEESSPELTDDDEEGDEVVNRRSVTEVGFKTPAMPPAKPKSRTCRPPPPARFSTPVSAGLTTPRTPLSPLDRHAPTHDRPNSTGHTPQTCGFLRSLTTDLPASRRHLEAARFVKNFKKLKEDLTAKLFRMYNETVFESKLPSDLPIQWNPRMTKTAGFCTYKKTVSAADVQRTAKVELSIKVCDSAERVRDTLIHELCHAAVWLFYGKTDGHGHHWKHWARKSNLIHPDLPVISRCHSYDIQTKYTYQCTKCGYKIGRHSKSLNTDKKVCGYCHGTFELFRNNPSASAGTPGKPVSATPQTPRTPNRFAMFVKENYGTVKKQQGHKLSHKEVMQKLSAEFALKGKIT